MLCRCFRLRWQFWRMDDEQRAMRERMQELEVNLDRLFILLPPRKINEFFDMNETLGSGGFGTVFRGTATELGLHSISGIEPGRPYAVKRVKRSKKGLTEAIGKSMIAITSERHIEFCCAMADARQCSENYVLGFRAFFIETGKAIFQVMDVLEGPDLFDFLASHRRGLGEQRSSELARMILLALHYFHRTLGALHRDVKPENFGFCSPVVPDKPLPQLMLFDIGLSWVLPQPINDQTAYSLLKLPRVGTAIYLAPETWAGNSGPPSDIWGAGIICHLFLSMELPYRLLQSRSPMKTVQYEQLTMSSKPWTVVSEDAQKFVRSLLEKDPASRCSTAMALADPWLRIPGNIPPTESMLESLGCDPELPERGAVGSGADVWQSVMLEMERTPRYSSVLSVAGGA